MTTDELIAKLLDGTLSASERHELNALVTSSPELAEEIHNLTAIEQLLRSHPSSPIVEEAQPFLHTIENNIAATMATQSRIPLVAGKNALWLATLPFALLLGGVTFALFQPSNTQQNAVPQHRAEAPPALHIELPAASHTPAPNTRNNTQALSAQRNKTVPTPSVRQPNEQKPPVVETEQSIANNDNAQATIDGSARITPPPTANVSIETYRKQFDQAVQSGNKVQATMMAKTIGVLQRQSGNTAEAREFLLSALKLSREVRLADYEAETLGELGLTAKAMGNTDEARTYLRSCVSLLTNSSNPTSLARWQKELKAVE